MYWDKRLRPATTILAKLTQSQRFAVAMACIDDVREVFDGSVVPLVPEGGRQFFASAQALLSRAREISDVAREPARELVHEASWTGDAPPGVWDMAMALLHLLNRAGTELSGDDVLEVMSATYQIVLHVEIMNKLDHNALESEIAQMEEANPACVACIERQLLHIAAAAAA